MPEFKLQKIDDSLRSQHSYLEPEDQCFFWGEYASGLKFEPESMHQLIFNFKKFMERKGKIDWYYKEKAIRKVADLILSLSNWSTWSQCTWVPMPPSKMSSDKDYDDRLIQVLDILKNYCPLLDVRNILFSKKNREPTHVVGGKRTVEFHKKP